MKPPADVTLTDSEKAHIATIVAEIEREKQKKAERIKRCKEDPVFAAEFERSMQEKLSANRGLAGSRYADPASDDLAPVFRPVRQTDLLFQPQPRAAVSSPFLNSNSKMVDGNSSPPSPAVAASFRGSIPAAKSRFATTNDYIPPHLRVSASWWNSKPESMAPVSSDYIPPHLRAAIRDGSLNVTFQSHKNPWKADIERVLPSPHLQPVAAAVAAAVQPAPEAYILQHLRASSSKRSVLQPSQQANLQPSTSTSSSPPTQGPPALVSAAPISNFVNVTVPSQQFLAANMRSGLNVRKCEALSYYQHGPNPVEPEYELYVSDESSRSSGASNNEPDNAQAQNSALQQTQQQAPESATTTPQSKTVLGINEAESSGTASSVPRQTSEMTLDDYVQFLVERNERKASGGPLMDLPVSFTRGAGHSTTSISAPALQDSIPVISSQQPTTVISQGTAALSSKSDAIFTAAELLFMQNYIKPGKLPHQWNFDELRELHEYERLMKMKPAQPQTPEVVSVAEAHASPEKQISKGDMYGVPKKATPPSSSKSKTSPQAKHAFIGEKYGALKNTTTTPNSSKSMTSQEKQGSMDKKYGSPKKGTTSPRSSKSKTPSPKRIRRDPRTIDASTHPIWSRAITHPNDYLIALANQPRTGTTYHRNADYKPEPDDWMSTSRPGAQVWVDTITIGGDHVETSAVPSDKENVEPSLQQKSAPQKPVVGTSLITSEKTSSAAANLPPHLRPVNLALEQSLAPKPVETATLVTSDKIGSAAANLPPHLRAVNVSLEQSLPQKSVAGTSLITSDKISSPATTLPPHLRPVNITHEQNLPRKSIKPVVEITVAAPSSNALPPHLRVVGAAAHRLGLEQKSPPQKFLNSTSTDSLPPHLRGGILEDDEDAWNSIPPQIKAKEDTSLAASNSAKVTTAAAYVPPHLRVSKQPDFEFSVPKKQDLKAPARKNISSPIFLPPHIRRNIAQDKPAVVKAFLENLRTKDTPNPSNPGFLPARSGNTTFGSSDSNSFDAAWISDDGLENPKENVRATQGRDATDQLLDFDGTWLAPPCDWDDRGGADCRYMGSYIKEWAGSIELPSKPINTTAPEFRSGHFVVGEGQIVKPPVHGPTIPVIQPEIEDKRIAQTANAESHVYTTALKARQAEMYAAAQINAERRKQIAMAEPEPNPFCPTVDMYVRPATTKDLAGIAKIYNYYVNNSIIPEDQKDVTEQDMKFLLHSCKENDLPFIVAVKGKLPSSTDAQGRKLNKVVVPQHETILGFTFVQIQAFGFGSANTFNGRSRMNANLHLYVHNEFLKQGVGRNLLDRLLLCMDHAHAFNDGAGFVNPENDKRYGLAPVRWHRLFCQVAVDRKDDAQFARASRFLAKAFFYETHRQTNGARTTTSNVATRFADLVHFNRTVVPEGVFSPLD